MRVLLSAGAILAVALLAQTIVGYRYVSRNLIEQAGRRVAIDRVRSVEQAMRLARPADAAGIRQLLDDLRQPVAEVASIELIGADGTVFATSGGPVRPSSHGRDQRLPRAGQVVSLTPDRRDGRDILVGTWPCRCGAPPSGGRGAATAESAALVVRVALYRDALSAPFARLRRDALVSTSAALALLVSLAVIGARFSAYVRGQQLDAQMILARRVQRDLLPAADSLPRGLDVAAVCRQASHVGGDFYDVVPLDGSRVGFLLGDVSGHGVSAALLMGLVHGAMSGTSWRGRDDGPEGAAGRLNDLLLAKSSDSTFVSLFWSAYDPRAQRLQYVNAGHLPALWVRRVPNGVSVERLAEGGPVLGLLPALRYESVWVETSVGDLLVLYSDGLVEAVNRRGEYFGEARLTAVVLEHCDRAAEEIRDAMIGAVSAFAGRQPIRDDQTVLVVRLWGEPRPEGATPIRSARLSARSTSRAG